MQQLPRTILKFEFIEPFWKVAVKHHRAPKYNFFVEGLNNAGLDWLKFGFL